MKARRDLALLFLVLVLSVGGPAYARQLDASEAPTVTGPLTDGEPACDEKVVDEGREGEESEIIAMVTLCTRLYRFDPTAETDEANNYGVLWLQSNVDARHDWCATEVNTSALIEPGGTVTQYSPAHQLSTKKKKQVSISLKVDAQGNATETARLVQELIMFPARFRTQVGATEDGTLVRGHWTGSAGRKLAFATATEISFPAGVSSPEMLPELTYTFVKKDKC